MAIVDREGRFFGRLNLFDASAIVVVLAIAALTVVGYRLLRVPIAPTIVTLTPSTLTAGPDLRVVVKGENLLPYLHVYLQRTAQPNAVMHDISPMAHFDGYVLVNFAQARFLVESPTLAEIRLPDDLLPGTYDLVIYNETNIVAVRQAALIVNPASPPKPTHSSDPEAVVRIRGAFSGLSREAATTLAGGTKLPGGTQDPWGEILSVKAPAPDEARLDFGATAVMAKMANRWQVRAELRVRCTVNASKCYLPNGGLLQPGGNVTIDVGGKALAFVVAEVLPGEPQALTTVNATVRFVGRTSVLAMVHAQDVDLSPGDDRDVAATIVSVERLAEMTSELNENLVDGSIRGQEKVGALECVVRIPVTRVATGWWYRGQSIKAGAAITFQTDQYTVRGAIENLGPRSPK
ncbi:MAG: DUF4330 family protein [Acidobacteria bacterium]|nr:DUF4330 family protein [Acidobacteriota bacterium]